MIFQVDVKTVIWYYLYMINIAMVEDEAGYADQLKGYLETFATEYGEEFEISHFTDGDEILVGYNGGFDIILMDIQMKLMDGMTAAEEIRKLDPEVVIIFITNMAQYAIRGYAVDALDYVLKPVSYFALSQRLERAIDRMKRRTASYMNITIKGGTQKLDISKIYYIESYNHNLIFHTKNGEYTSAGTIKDAEEILAQHGFYRGNKGYIINLKYVDGMREGCAMVGGEPLLISRARKSGFMKALTNYIGEALK